MGPDPGATPAHIQKQPGILVLQRPHPVTQTGFLHHQRFRHLSGDYFGAGLTATPAVLHHHTINRGLRGQQLHQLLQRHGRRFGIHANHRHRRQPVDRQPLVTGKTATAAVEQTAHLPFCARQLGDNLHHQVLHKNSCHRKKTGIIQGIQHRR